MPEQFLDCSNVLSCLEQMSRETVPKGMARDLFGDTCPTNCISDLLLNCEAFERCCEPDREASVVLRSGQRWS